MGPSAFLFFGSSLNLFSCIVYTHIRIEVFISFCTRVDAYHPYLVILEEMYFVSHTLFPTNSCSLGHIYYRELLFPLHLFTIPTKYHVTITQCSKQRLKIATIIARNRKRVRTRTFTGNISGYYNIKHKTMEHTERTIFWTRHDIVSHLKRTYQRLGYALTMTRSVANRYVYLRFDRGGIYSTRLN